MQKLSIIIVNYKGWEALRACLDSLAAYKSAFLEFEVIVVDNCSNDGFFTVFKTDFPLFTFIENSGNNGFANGCNLGAKQATSDLYLFLNPDTVIYNDSLDKYITDYIKNPEIAILSCLQVDENNSFYKQKNRFPTFFSFFGLSRAFYKRIFKNKIEKSFKENVSFFYPQWVTGAVVLISKHWFEKVNGWNEDFWMYMEDVDLCKKVIDQNGIVAVTKKSNIFHKHGGASRINVFTKALTKTEVLISKHVYINTHFNVLQQVILHFFMVLGVLLEKGILSIISFFVFKNLKLKVNRFILKNYLSYLLHALNNKTFLSFRSVNFNKN